MNDEVLSLHHMPERRDWSSIAVVFEMALHVSDAPHYVRRPDLSMLCARGVLLRLYLERDARPGGQKQHVSPAWAALVRLLIDKS